MDDFKSFGEIFNKDQSLNNFRESVKKADLVAKFDEIFPDLKKIAKPVKVEKNILFLSVENSVWRSELKFKQQIMVDKINDYFKDKIIKAVKFLA